MAVRDSHRMARLLARRAIIRKAGRTRRLAACWAAGKRAHRLLVKLGNRVANKGRRGQAVCSVVDKAGLKVPLKVPLKPMDNPLAVKLARKEQAVCSVAVKVGLRARPRAVSREILRRAGKRARRAR